MKIIQLDQPKTQINQKSISELAKVVFESIEHDYIEWRMDNMPDLSVFVAQKDGDWVGFKIGYGMTNRRYYSWLGGVHPLFRGQGVASKLMNAQHRWLTSTSYQVVETHIKQDNVPMFLTNQKAGFLIQGRFNKADEVNLILQKTL